MKTRSLLSLLLALVVTAAAVSIALIDRSPEPEISAKPESSVTTPRRAPISSIPSKKSPVTPSSLPAELDLGSAMERFAQAVADEPHSLSAADRQTVDTLLANLAIQLENERANTARN